MAFKMMTKDEIKALRVAEMQKLAKASQEAAQMMRETGITPDILARIGRLLDRFSLDDIVTSPAHRATVVACQLVMSRFYAIGPGEPLPRQPPPEPALT
jgi:hypothetical protein